MRSILGLVSLILVLSCFSYQIFAHRDSGVRLQQFFGSILALRNDGA